MVILADKKLKSAQTFVSLSLFVIIGPIFCGYGVHPSTPLGKRGMINACVCSLVKRSSHPVILYFRSSTEFSFFGGLFYYYFFFKRKGKRGK